MSLELDWSLLEWVKPYDHEMVRYSKGESLNDSMIPVQYMNWAHKEVGNLRYTIYPGYPSSEDIATLIAVCQKYVKEHDLKEPEVAPVEVKKKGWFW